MIGRLRHEVEKHDTAWATICLMDDNTRLVLITTVPVVAGALIALIGFRFSKGIEERRAIREAAARREAWDREDRRRWSSERRELYGRMLRNAERLRDAARDMLLRRTSPELGILDPSDAISEASAELYGLFAEISLVAPAEVGSAAEALHDAASRLPFAASGALLATGRTISYPEADSAYLAAWKAFRAAAGKDLA